MTPTDEVQPGSGYNRVSVFTWVLVVIPFLGVFFILGRYGIAAEILAAGAGATWLARKSRTRGTEAPRVAFSILGAVLVLFIILPILNLLFTTAPLRIVEVARDASVRDAMFLTLSTAMVATLLSLLFGIPLGYVLAREQFAGKSFVEGIIDMPVVIPHTIAGVALLFIFGRGGVIGAPLSSSFHVLLTDSYWGIVLAMVFVGMPFLVNHARDGFLKVDARMENVARSLGASHFGAFFRVTIPLTWRALLSGAIMTWARAISEFGSVAVIAYYPRTINTLLFEWYNFFGYEYTKPLAALLLLVSLAIFVGLRAVSRITRPEHDQT